MWSQDHVALIIESGGLSMPYALIQRDNIPVYTAGGDPRAFASIYPSIFIYSGSSIQWSAETAYWLVKIEHKQPKSVAVMYTAGYSAYNHYIQGYWNKLGVQKVDFVPDLGPTASCNAYVLKWKAEGVDYIDEQGQQWPQCLGAEAQLGWKPALGQGGPATSEIAVANLIGPAMNGVVAGSPGLLHTGQPLYTSQPPALVAYTNAIKKYAPQFATDQYLDGTTTQFGYVGAEIAADSLKAALNKYGTKFSTKDLITATQGLTNIQTTIEPTVVDLAPSCKAGADGTIWGYWHYNAAAKQNVFVPTSGRQWVTDDFFGFGHCYMTLQANKSFG
jgi:hypothetical protein